MINVNDSPYKGSGSLTRAQFLYYEMRITARLMEELSEDEEILKRIVSENLFSKINISSSLLMLHLMKYS